MTDFFKQMVRRLIGAAALALAFGAVPAHAGYYCQYGLGMACGAAVGADSTQAGWVGAAGQVPLGTSWLPPQAPAAVKSWDSYFLGQCQQSQTGKWYYIRGDGTIQAGYGCGVGQVAAVPNGWNTVNGCYIGNSGTDYYDVVTPLYSGQASLNGGQPYGWTIVTYPVPPNLGAFMYNC